MSLYQPERHDRGLFLERSVGDFGARLNLCLLRARAHKFIGGSIVADALRRTYII